MRGREPQGLAAGKPEDPGIPKTATTQCHNGEYTLNYSWAGSILLASETLL